MIVILLLFSVTSVIGTKYCLFFIFQIIAYCVIEVNLASIFFHISWVLKAGSVTDRCPSNTRDMINCVYVLPLSDLCCLNATGNSSPCQLWCTTVVLQIIVEICYKRTFHVDNYVFTSSVATITLYMNSPVFDTVCLKHDEIHIIYHILHIL